MDSIEYLILIPCWYWTIAFIFGVFYSFRGIVEKMIMIANNQLYLSNQIETWQKVVIIYIQEVILKFLITISSFIAFYVACEIFPSPNQIDSVSPGKAVILIFLFVWGIIGICGYLSFFITRGKIPGIK
ncbi:MAG: hypothetical protein HN580_24155 [Deltaproteobacteria bacterium]|nr:hypothetical protein [Deltaproteobacteria bacterium]MBT4087207.1 hypothetical protein [Deltaproteobacteria bacterium]MBT4267915.1 hypothetical protein [Deltaproteobacteria bacterium]MBT4643839.1 hypothetical protein [Deltaproteobacteria bacterium]MBT6502774.1 hypothetical protein [Deltaproteobacteria bacterium]